jgi:DNA-binding NarL/FixJ family response regulator
MRVLLVDDHAVVRHGLTELLSTAGHTVVGSLEDGAGAAAAVLQLQPDVVLMDLSMPGVDGVDATQAITRVSPDTKVIVLTSFAEHTRVHAALAAGAVGYLLKDSEPADILRALHDADSGGVPLSPRAATALLPQNQPTSNATIDSLTDRERDVLRLVAAGLPNKSVARRLQISEKTVKAHLTRVFAVLGVHDRTSAALWAQRHGMA